MDAERKSALLGAKLRALIAGRGQAFAPISERDAAPSFLRGAAVVDGDTGWVLIEDRPHAALGPAMAWAQQAGVTELNLLVEHDDGALARRSTAFSNPTIVWRIDGRSIELATPQTYEPPAAPPVDEVAAADVLLEVGADVVVEHGVVIGEVMGLEVARVVVGEAGPRLEVGVGRHDRMAFAMMHGEMPPLSAIASVVETVRRHRAVGAEAHPLNRLAAAQLIRWHLTEHPSMVGADHLRAVDTTEGKANVKDAVPAAALGVLPDGTELVVVCSTGIDLDLMPAAADVRLTTAPTANLVVMLPERDFHRATIEMAAALHKPAELVAVPDEWRR